MGNLHAQWDMGWMIWVIILAVIAGLCWLTAIVGGIIFWRSKGGYGGMTAVIAVVFALIVGIIGTIVAFPFSGQYHRYVPESGTVTAIGSRFLASDTQGGGTTQKFVVTFADGRSFGCLDTRCANVDKGDELTLLCKRVFQFNAPSEGYDCNWGGDVKANGVTIP